MQIKQATMHKADNTLCIHNLREFVYELPSSWPPARVEGGSGQQSMTPERRDNRDPGDPGIVPRGLLLSNTHTVSAYWQVQDGAQRSFRRRETQHFAFRRHETPCFYYQPITHNDLLPDDNPK